MPRSDALDATLGTCQAIHPSCDEKSLATSKIEDIRQERWPSQNEPRCAFNDPAMDVASNNFAVFSQRIDVTPCRSDEETS